MTDVTVRWAGPSDAASGSTYKVERTLDNSSWTTLAASQAATAPYASDSTTLATNASYGASSVGPAGLLVHDLATDQIGDRVAQVNRRHQQLAIVPLLGVAVR